MLTVSHPQNPPATRPSWTAFGRLISRAGGHHGGTPPHRRQGSPMVSPRTPFPSPSRPTRGCRSPPAARRRPHRPTTPPGRPPARHHGTSTSPHTSPTGRAATMYPRCARVPCRPARRRTPPARTRSDEPTPAQARSLNTSPHPRHRNSRQRTLSTAHNPHSRHRRARPPTCQRQSHPNQNHHNHDAYANVAVLFVADGEGSATTGEEAQCVLLRGGTPESEPKSGSFSASREPASSPSTRQPRASSARSGGSGKCGAGDSHSQRRPQRYLRNGSQGTITAVRRKSRLSPRPLTAALPERPRNR
jgi:hypothetical protein